ncbi:hypothetical protein HELRODRAFT_180665 [Helobdella robusta]|uniref:Uncharacterized protein n=1 Tax=Helobdella robusta TaxID=6412 RepID=T1FG51_HELRO|nr:hypothetical protein HELRODRAFT_180665 [Helobdella robusta]ESN93795.1 hypothetical protein HELRODRAFT_180665 [Helobdella robusta]
MGTVETINSVSSDFDEEVRKKIFHWKRSVTLEKDRMSLQFYGRGSKDSYIDPRSGYTVLTFLFHLKKEKCCGNGCRHCPYSHKNVPHDKNGNRGTYNGAFFKNW